MTIKEAQIKIYGKEGRGLEKKILRTEWEGKVPGAHKPNQPYTDEIAKAIKLPLPADLHLVQVPQAPSTKKVNGNKPRRKTPAHTARSASAPLLKKQEPKKAVFESEYVFLVMIILVCLIDGIALAKIAYTQVGQSYFIQGAYFVGGVILAYTAFKNAYELLKIETKSWETSPATPWIILFTVLQIILHGAATNFFASWNEIISKGLIAICTPTASAALSIIIFHNNKNQDK